MRCSALIDTPEEARNYYAERLGGSRTVSFQRKGKTFVLTVVFEHDGTHLFSEAIKPGSIVDSVLRVPRLVPAGRGAFREEVRQFSLDRARLLDHVIRAISLFTVAVPEAGGRTGHQKTVIYGPALPDGRRMRVILRPGPGEARTCVSAYPVSAEEWIKAGRLQRARFP